MTDQKWERERTKLVEGHSGWGTSDNGSKGSGDLVSTGRLYRRFIGVEYGESGTFAYGTERGRGEQGLLLEQPRVGRGYELEIPG